MEMPTTSLDVHYSKGAKRFKCISRLISNMGKIMTLTILVTMWLVMLTVLAALHPAFGMLFLFATASNMLT